MSSGVVPIVVTSSGSIGCGLRFSGVSSAGSRSPVHLWFSGSRWSGQTGSPQ